MRLVSGKRRLFNPPPPWHSEWLWGPHSLLSNGYWGLFPSEAQQSQYKADESLLPSAEVEFVELYFQYPVHLQCLLHQAKEKFFVFTFLMQCLYVIMNNESGPQLLSSGNEEKLWNFRTRNDPMGEGVRCIPKMEYKHTRQVFLFNSH